MRTQAGRWISLALVLAACTSDPQTTDAAADGLTAPPSSTASLPVGSHVFLDIATGQRTPAGVSMYEAGMPEVSPDGKSVVWFTFDDGITVSALDGSAEVAVSPHGLDGYAATWVDDETILFQGRPTGGPEDQLGDLYEADVSTGKATMVTDLPLEKAGSWFVVSDVSPDGTTVLFHLPQHGKEKGSWDLWTAPIAGGQATVLRKDAGFAQYGPDGSIVFFDHPASFAADAIWIMDGDGRHARPLVEGGHYTGTPLFSPDGTKVAYANDETVEIVDVASGEVTKLDASTHHSDPAWYDDGTLIVD
jgi:Tol biopolymer transport system component